jgi:hypothetical protein
VRALIKKAHNRSTTLTENGSVDTWATRIGKNTKWAKEISDAIVEATWNRDSQPL